MVSVIQHVLTPKSRTGEDSIAGFQERDHRAKVIQKPTCLTALVERFTQGRITSNRYSNNLSKNPLYGVIMECEQSQSKGKIGS